MDPERKLPTRVLRAVEVVLHDRVVEADLVLMGSTIDALLPAGTASGDEVWNLEGRRVRPGLVDLHNHGGWGIDFYRDGADKIVECADRYSSIGVTSLLATLHPGPIDEMLERLSEAARACVASGVLLGIHLEGPFISHDRRGALPAEGILPWDGGVMDRILDAACGQLRVMTFAPEAIPTSALKSIRSAGVMLSIGHTSADAGCTRAAIDAGVWRCTHLCNAMPPMHHRSPGPVPVLLTDDRVRCEVILDGQHLDDDFVRLALALKEEDSLMAVSDAMPLAGLGETSGSFVGKEILSDGKRATLSDGTLAGSVMALPDALTRTASALSLSPSRIAALGSLAPAMDLGLKRHGRIASGCRADLVVEEAGRGIAVLTGGERVGGEEDTAWMPEGVLRVQ